MSSVSAMVPPCRFSSLIWLTSATFLPPPDVGDALDRVDGDLREVVAGAVDALRAHRGRGGLEQHLAVVEADLGADLGLEEALGLLEGDVVAAGDDRGVDLLVEERLGALQHLAGEHDRGRGAIAALLVLGLGDLHQHLRGRMLDVDLLEDRDAIVRDRDVAHRVDEHLVHPARAERRADGVGDRARGGDVVARRAAAAVAFGPFLKHQNRRSLHHWCHRRPRSTRVIPCIRTYLRPGACVVYRN